MLRITLLISSISLLSGCAIVGAAMAGVATHSASRYIDRTFGHENLMTFAYANGLSPQCAERENRKLLLGIALESNKNMLIEKCRLDYTDEDDFERDRNLMLFAHANGLSPQCIERESIKLDLEITLESNKKALIEKCKYNDTSDTNHGK